MKLWTLFLILSIILTAGSNALPTLNSDIRIKVINETAFDYSIYLDEDIFVSTGEETSTFYLNNELKNLEFYDNLGELKILGKINDSDSSAYFTEWRYGKPGVIRGVYINASSSEFFGAEKGILELFAPTLAFINPGGIDENYHVEIEFPKEYELIYEKEGCAFPSESETRFRCDYKNPGEFIAFTLIEPKKKRALLKKVEDGKSFYLENDDKLIEGFEEAIKYKESVWNFPRYRADTIYIFRANISEINAHILAYYLNSNVIIVHDALNTKEEIASILLHELTHYSLRKYYGILNYWEGMDIDEGIAEYTRIKYIEEKYPSSEGHIPESGILFGAKPYKEYIEQWYSNSDVETTILASFKKKLNWTDTRYYNILGFIVNYYVSSYGNETFDKAMKRSKKNLEIGVREFGGIYGDDGEVLFLRGLVESPSPALSRQKLFFPEASLFKNDREKFWQKMAPYISQISEEEANEKYALKKGNMNVELKINNEGEKDISKGTEKRNLNNLIYAGIAIAGLFIIVLIARKAFYKKEFYKKRHRKRL